VGLVIGFYIPHPSLDEEYSSELRIGAGTYTNALLECEVARDSIAVQKKNFTPQLEDFVNTKKEQGRVSEMAVYFRDLNNGPVVGINQDFPFAPASLLKLPLLISYLLWAGEKPEVLDEQIVYRTPVDVGYVQEFPPGEELVEGKSYSARELLERMIRYSDNQAYVLLIKELPPKYEEDLFTLLGIDPSVFVDATKKITVRQYSSFFRILYNASFLSFKNSEDALALLTQTTFSKGLRAGVPPEIPIAHKFGERKTKEGIQQFHDCGIVYYPKFPYLICIMTRGNDSETLIDVIRDTSAFVYEQVGAHYAQ
jgi:beta-lactamase class A